MIHHIPEDGAHPYQWGIQIHPEDGGIVVIGYVDELKFDPDIQKTLAELALSEHQSFDWWQNNSVDWFARHRVNF